MLGGLGILIAMAKEGNFRFDPEPELNLLYGEEPSLEGAYLRNTFRRFVQAAKAARSEGGDSRSSGLAGGDPDAWPPSIQNPKAKTHEPPPTDPERLLLLKELFAAKQRVLRRYLALLAGVHRDHPRAAPGLLRPQRGGRHPVDAFGSAQRPATASGAHALLADAEGKRRARFGIGHSQFGIWGSNGARPGVLERGAGRRCDGRAERGAQTSAFEVCGLSDHATRAADLENGGPRYEYSDSQVSNNSDEK